MKYIASIKSVRFRLSEMSDKHFHLYVAVSQIINPGQNIP